jgi:hypothetical protein
MTGSGELNAAALTELKGRRCLALLVREHWIMGECRGEAAALYLQLDDKRWVEIAPDKREACWVLSTTDADHTHGVFGDGDSHDPARDIGAAYDLNGQRIEGVNQKKLGGRIELCLEFANATDITVHYNLITDESSLYFIRD